MKALLLLALPIAALASPVPTTRLASADLVDLELEQLTRITVTSVSRREERLFDTAASIYVVTAEDIRRSGARSLMEALRLAPNLMVMRSGADNGSVGARGGMSGGVNKMLVLIDGRTVYSPLFSGVFWDAQDVMLENVERIEVVSGPGSTLWGTNAVNGLIRIVTKAAGATPGLLASAGGGNLDREANLRIGGRLPGGEGAWRAYARSMDRDARSLLSGASAQDASRRYTAGFRGDWSRGATSATLQGDAYAAWIDSPTTTRKLDGANLLARYSFATDAGTEVVAQAWLDHYTRDQFGSLDEKRDTADLEVQVAPRPFGRHWVVWGGDLRTSRDRTVPFPALGFVPASKTLDTASLYAQDDWRLSDEFRATFGLRAERNPYTGLEWLPTARLAWMPNPDHMGWLAATRAVRSPARVDREAVSPGTPPYVLAPNDTFEAEIADVVELGYRGRLGPLGTLSAAVFHHELEGLRTAQRVGSVFIAANGADTKLDGLEAWIEARITEGWRFTVGGTILRERTTDRPGFVNVSTPPYGNNPRRTAFLRSLWNVAPSIDFDVLARHQSELSRPVVPGFTVVDARLGWQVSKDLEVALSVENAFDRQAVEFSPTSSVPERSWFVKLTYRP